MPYRLGYACINATLRKNHKIRANRRAIKATYESKGLPHIGSLIEQNLNDLYTILQWNVEHKIRVFRLSSCLLYTSPSPRDLSTSRMPSSA